MHRHTCGATLSAADRQPNLDWHDDPLVGQYVRTKIGTWWTDTLLKSLGYKVRLIALGSEPTFDQVACFETLAASIPTIVRAAELEPIPKDDGWGHAPPPFDINKAHVGSIRMNGDGTFFLIFDVDPEGPYMLAPAFVISADYKLISAEWSV